jgi:hypothetical protein
MRETSSAVAVAVAAGTKVLRRLTAHTAAMSGGRAACRAWSRRRRRARTGNGAFLSKRFDTGAGTEACIEGGRWARAFPAC